MIETAFGQLAFSTPWALASLLVLPALYLLLRVTPPGPRKIVFPATRFLEGLTPKTQTPSKTPWWILLMRLLAAGLLLLALAGPVLNPSHPLAGAGPLRLVIDNDWAAAQNWTSIQGEAETLIQQAGREGREIYIQTTAPEREDQTIALQGPLAPSEALALVRALKPVPWMRASLQMDTKTISASTVWLSGGVWSGSEKRDVLNVIARYQADGDFTLFRPEKENLPLALKSAESQKQIPVITLAARKEIQALPSPAHVQLIGLKGEILDDQATSKTGDVVFDIPASLAAQAARFQIAGQRGAQAHYYLDAQSSPKSVGIVTTDEQADPKPLGDGGFYLKKALEPYATISTGSLSQLLKDKPGMIILPDIAALPTAQLNALDEWVKGGGLLLRFAGINMTRETGAIPLTPVPLRATARAVDGSLSWDKPLKIAPLAPDSPLYGLEIAGDIEINQQILAQPSEDLAAHTWAALSDGTPLITGAEHGAGLLVMVHTSASPDWSNLPLSGFYVNMLRKFTGMAGRSFEAMNATNGMLQPARVMDGFGALQDPSANVMPIDAAAFENIKPSPAHPPGLYGQGPNARTLNLGDSLREYGVMDHDAFAVQSYSAQQESALAPALITGALMLLAVDLLVMSAMGAGLFLRTAFVLALLIVPARAQDAQHAQGLYLAYIKTGDAQLDAQTARGLDVLSQILVARTSADMQGAIGLDPARDPLVFYPLIYWAVSPNQANPPDSALEKLQYYLDHGGTIIMDTRDGQSGQNNEALRRLLGGLNIQPLIPLPEDHVLTKSFYLLKRFPGRAPDGQIWVEEQSTGRDGVSSVILSSNDWAGAWSQINLAGTAPRFYALGASREEELSLRSGVNLMMYALTGNYKSDQVHVPAILERLGK